MKSTYYKSFALIAALFYAISIPASKLLLNSVSPYLLSSLVYLGAGIGIFIIRLFIKDNKDNLKFNKKDIPYISAMIILDIIAPILLMFGILNTSASNVSLLSNFELVFTALLAFLFFKEKITRKLWVAISIIVTAGIILSINIPLNLDINIGLVFVLIATLAWGLENNITRVLSVKDPLAIVIIKGLGSGSGALIVATLLNQLTYEPFTLLYGLLLGFVSYGLSLVFYIKAQSRIGATMTSSFFATSPFIGTAIAIIFLNEAVTFQYMIALVLMISGVVIVFKE